MRSNECYLVNDFSGRLQKLKNLSTIFHDLRNVHASMNGKRLNVKIKTVTIRYNGVNFSGNDQDIILEQLEQQNITIPYSCRAGICESCKLTLLQGEVIALKKEALCDDGGILSCSCIPNSNITLTGPGDA